MSANDRRRQEAEISTVNNNTQQGNILALEVIVAEELELREDINARNLEEVIDHMHTILV